MIRRILCLTAASSFILLGFTGCEDKEENVNFNPEFSINLLRPGDKWPNEKKITPLQKSVYDKYGKPDFFRLIWNRQGTIVIRDQFNPGDKERLKKARDLPTTWVYTDRNMELVFTGTNFVEKPLTDDVKLVVQSGDPEGVRQAGPGVTEWTYYSTGNIYKMVNGKIVEHREFPGMGSFLK